MSKKTLTGTLLRALPSSRAGQTVKPVASLREVNALLLRASAFPDRKDDLYMSAAEIVKNLDYSHLVAEVKDKQLLHYDVAVEIEKIKQGYAQKILNGEYSPSEAVLRARGMDKRVHSLIEDAKHGVVQAREVLKARREGLVLIWVPERDACTFCRSVAGQIIHPGDKFHTPDGSYAMAFPPAHPNCRCRQQAVKINNNYELSQLQRNVTRILDQGKTQSESREAIYAVLSKIVKPIGEVSRQATRGSVGPLPISVKLPPIQTKAINITKFTEKLAKDAASKSRVISGKRRGVNINTSPLRARRK